MTDEARLQVSDAQREVLVAELDGFLETTAALYRQIGRQFDPGDPASVGPEVAPVARAREQLTGDGPWSLTGDPTELRFLLSRLRAGAELALERGARPSPGRPSQAMHVGDADGTDQHLDILGVADELLSRLDAPTAS